MNFCIYPKLDASTDELSSGHRGGSKSDLQFLLFYAVELCEAKFRFFVWKIRSREWNYFATGLVQIWFYKKSSSFFVDFYNEMKKKWQRKNTLIKTKFDDSSVKKSYLNAFPWTRKLYQTKSKRLAE